MFARRRLRHLQKICEAIFLTHFPTLGVLCGSEREAIASTGFIVYRVDACSIVRRFLRATLRGMLLKLLNLSASRQHSTEN
jgi:hypothetical protein